YVRGGAFHVVDGEDRANAWRQRATDDVSFAAFAQRHMRGLCRFTGARGGDVADERMVGSVEEFDRSGVGHKYVAADRKGRPITPGSEFALQRCEQCSFVRASVLQEPLLDLCRRAGDVGSEQRIPLTRQAGDIENTLEAAGVWIDDRMAIAAQAVQPREEMLVVVDGHRLTQFVGRGDGVGAGRLLAKNSAVQRLSQQLND